MRSKPLEANGSGKPVSVSCRAIAQRKRHRQTTHDHSRRRPPHRHRHRRLRRRPLPLLLRTDTSPHILGTHTERALQRRADESSGAISKRGNSYLRTLLVHGGTVCSERAGKESRTARPTPSYWAILARGKKLPQRRRLSPSPTRSHESPGPSLLVRNTVYQKRTRHSRSYPDQLTTFETSPTFLGCDDQTDRDEDSTVLPARGEAGNQPGGSPKPLPAIGSPRSDFFMARAREAQLKEAE